MNISKISIENFRLLNNTSIDMNIGLSLIIGKNNCGKTSLLSALDKFLNNNDKNGFNYNDFSIGFMENLKDELERKISNEEEYNKKPIGIYLNLTIKYNENDNLSNISSIMLSLDPEDTMINIQFGYIIPFHKATTLYTELSKIDIEEQIKYLKKEYKQYFIIEKKSILYDEGSDRIA